MADIPIAHIDDEGSMRTLSLTLQSLHGPGYSFGLLRWGDTVELSSLADHVTYYFVVRAEDATIQLRPGDAVRGGMERDAYRPGDDGCARVTKHLRESLWPGDLFTLGPGADETFRLHGRGVAFRVVVRVSGYVPPRLALLRHLPDKPGGCAAYPGAFRREALPPDRAGTSEHDARGTNRINEHTLDMRFDRDPPPVCHYHGPVTSGSDGLVVHSETAIVLPRRVYGLPEVGERDQGHLVIYRNPAEDLTDQVRIPVTPGSIVVTPATPDGVMGHCFENVFAMLVAIPGFVGPYHVIDEP